MRPLTSRGFSFIELLIAVALAGLLGTFAYKMMTSTTSVQINQKYLIEYRGIAAAGLDGLRKELQKIDLSLLKSDMPSQTSSFPGFIIDTYPSSVIGGEVLYYSVPYTDKPSFGVQMNFETPTYEKPGLTVDLGMSSVLHNLETWPWAANCAPISPHIAPTDFLTSFSDFYLLWVPGVSVLVTAGAPCHTDLMGKVEGITVNANALAFSRDLSDHRMFFPAGSFTARPMTPRKILLVSASTGSGASLAPVPHSSAVYVFPGTSVSTSGKLARSPTIPAKDLRFTVDVEGVETPYSPSVDTTKINAINVKIIGEVKTRSTSGAVEYVEVPIHFKVKFANRSSTIQDPPPEDKSLLTPDLKTIANRGIGQPAVDVEGGHPYLYVPTVDFVGAQIENALGYITVIDPADWSEPHPPIPLTWGGNNFVPTKIVVATDGLVIGGYTRAPCSPGACLRQAVFFHLPRVSPGNQIDWNVLPSAHPMGDENGPLNPAFNDPGIRTAGHEYYMPDTVHVAAQGNTIYWANYTLTDAPSPNGWDRPQIYKTSTSDWSKYEIVHEVNKYNGRIDNQGKVLGGIAIDPTEDLLYYCSDEKADPAALGNADNRGNCMVGDPTNVTFVTQVNAEPYPTPSPPVVPGEAATMADWCPFLKQAGTVTGMATDEAHNLFISHRWGFHFLPKAQIDKLKFAVDAYSPTYGYAIRDQYFNPLVSGNYSSGTWVTQYNVPTDYMSPEAQAAGFATYTLKNLLGFAVVPGTSDPTMLYYVHVTAPGASPTPTIGRFTKKSLTARARTVVQMSPVAGPGAANTATPISYFRGADVIPRVYRLLPLTGFDTGSTITHSPVNCNQYDLPKDSWDDCIRKRLGGLTP